MLPTSNLSPNKCVFSSKHRLVKRNLPFFQSKNKLQVTNQHSELRLFSLLKYDWFHVGLRINIWISLLGLLGTWTIAIILFAGIYMFIDKDNLDTDCGLGPPGEPIQFAPAFAFSLETCTTVGYGLPNGSNSFFEQCNAVQIAIYFQMVWSMMFNAFLFAFFFAKIAKSEARGVQVIFSNKAIISNRPDVPYPCFQFRVFDIDGSYPVVEAHVRVYVVTQKSPIPIPLRVVIPNDDYGSMLYLSLPSQVVHAMDAYSPLVPRSKTNTITTASMPGGGLHLRQVDACTNSRDDVMCPICGESYGNVDRLVRHGKYYKMFEKHDGYEVKGSHQEVDWDEVGELLTKSQTWTLQQLQAYFRSNISEVVCTVEGIDPLASGTFQAIHSYQMQDINFGEAHFADCVCLNINDELVVDLDFFHQIRPNVPIVDSERSRAVQTEIGLDHQGSIETPNTLANRLDRGFSDDEEESASAIEDDKNVSPWQPESKPSTPSSDKCSKLAPPRLLAHKIPKSLSAAEQEAPLRPQTDFGQVHTVVNAKTQKQQASSEPNLGQGTKGPAKQEDSLNGSSLLEPPTTIRYSAADDANF